jgi:parvulin-like peptidyl-prolyl isomerase
MRLSLVLALGLLLLGCADLTAPPSPSEPAPAATPAPIVTAVAAPVRAQPTAAAPGPERVHAAHILVAYQGAMRSHATRSKDEAKKIAGQLLARAKGGADFAQLARDFSDDPTAKQRGGDLGSFQRQQMTPKFSDAAFALGVGQVSDVVETEFGFHIIKRLE